MYWLFFNIHWNYTQLNACAVLREFSNIAGSVNSSLYSYLLDYLDLKAPAKWSQRISTTYPNIVGSAFASSGQTITAFQHNILQHVAHTFGHPVATCCDMLGVENQTSAHAPVQHCWANLAKRLQHYATSTNVAWKIWPVSNLSQQHPTCRNTSQQGSQTGIEPNNVAICCVEMLQSFGRGLISVPSLVCIMLVLHGCDQQGVFESTLDCLSSCERVEYAYINFCFWCCEVSKEMWTVLEAWNEWNNLHCMWAIYNWRQYLWDIPGRHCGWVVRAWDSRVQIPFCPLADVVLGGPEFNSFLAALVNSQLVCLPPVGILNLVMFIWIFIYYCLVTLVLKSPNGKWLIRYTFFF